MENLYCSIRDIISSWFDNDGECAKSPCNIADFGGDNVRVPAVGNLPISAVSGNTTCVVALPLPCKIGPSGSVLNGLPGTAGNGSVTFHQGTYVVQANDPDPLRDQGNANVHDLCDNPNTVSCDDGSNTIQFTSRTDLIYDSHTVTVVHDESHSAVTSVPLGTTVHDNATVSNHGTPSGTVDFARYVDTECTGQAVTQNNVPLVAGVAESSGFVTNSTSGLSYKAHYNGDANHNPSDGDCEPLTVEKLTPEVTTHIHDSLHNVVTSVPVGTQVHDKATVTGSNGAATGNVDFNLFANGACTGNPVSTQSGVALSGNPGSAESNATTANAALSYLVHYNGDDVYKSADGICEPLEVTKLTPRVSTEVHNPSHTDITNTPVNAGTVVHDKAFVSGSGANPSGTVDFKRFTNGTCNGSPANTQTGISLSNANPALAESSNFTSVAGAMSYLVHYSGDGNYSAADGVCEPLTVQEVPQGCTLTQGYWKNHPSAWPVSSLSLGSVSYTKAQLLNILKTPVKGNGLISLAHQLIAAKLNIASGASSSSIAAAIASADALIGGKVVPPVGSDYLSPSSTSSLTGALDNYNSGLTGPGHCSE